MVRNGLAAAALLLLSGSASFDDAMAERHLPDAQIASATHRPPTVDERREAREVALLSSQEALARYAERMWVLTILQVMLSAMGAIGLFFTIYLSRKSVSQTGLALIEQAKTNKMQLRAYVSVLTEDPILFSVGQIPHARIKLLNNGLTPAQRVVIYAATEYWDHGSIRGETPTTPFGNPDTINPGRGIILKIPLPDSLSAALKLKIEDMDCRSFIRVYGRVRYEDIYGDIQTIPFSHIHHGPDCLTRYVDEFLDVAA